MINFRVIENTEQGRHEAHGRRGLALDRVEPPAVRRGAPWVNGPPPASRERLAIASMAASHSLRSAGDFTRSSMATPRSRSQPSPARRNSVVPRRGAGASSELISARGRAALEIGGYGLDPRSRIRRSGRGGAQASNPGDPAPRALGAPARPRETGDRGNLPWRAPQGSPAIRRSIAGSSGTASAVDAGGRASWEGLQSSPEVARCGGRAQRFWLRQAQRGHDSLNI
jgi:hypothetical protein